MLYNHHLRGVLLWFVPQSLAGCPAKNETHRFDGHICVHFSNMETPRTSEYFILLRAQALFTIAVFQSGLGDSTEIKSWSLWPSQVNYDARSVYGDSKSSKTIRSSWRKRWSCHCRYFSLKHHTLWAVVVSSQGTLDESSMRKRSNKKKRPTLFYFLEVSKL